jgi:hypothetical protein
LEGALGPRHFSYILCQYKEKYNVIIHYNEITATIINSLQSQTIEDSELPLAFNRCVSSHIDLIEDDAAVRTFFERLFNFFCMKIHEFWRKQN